MNLSEIRQRVLDNLGDDGQAWAPAGEAAPYARIDRLVNDEIDALAILIERVDPTFMRRGTDLTLGPAGGVDIGIGNTGSSPLPADFKRMISLWEHEVGIEPHEVQIIEPDRVPMYFGLSQTVAFMGTAEPSPAAVAISAPRTYIHVQKVRATARYTLWYTARVRAMAEASDTPSIPLEFHYVIVLGVTLRAMNQENSEVDQYRKSYDAAKAEMLAALPARDGSFTMPIQ